MKTIICFASLLGIMLVISPMPGCGSGEDESKKAVPEPAAPQTVVEQKAVLPAENNQATSQKTEPTQVTETQPTESAKVTEVQPTVQEIVDVIVIENKRYTTDKKGPVKFNHVKHNKEYKVSCVECHHLYKDGKNLWKEGSHVDKCIVCHDPVEEKDKVIKLQDAFHKNCRDCHTKVNKEGKKAPDKKCSGCHGG